MTNTGNTDADADDLLGKNLVIAVSRAVRLSLLHRLENDAIAATSLFLRDAVSAAHAQASAAVVKAGADGVFVNGKLVRPIGEVQESAERLHKHFVRLGVETLAFDVVPDDAAVLALLGAFQACTPGNAAPLLTLAVAGIRARAPGQAGVSAGVDGRDRAAAALADVATALDDLRRGRSHRSAALRKALQRLVDASSGAGADAIVAGAVCGLDDGDRGAGVAALVVLAALRAGRSPKDAVDVGFLAALASPHASIDDVAAAASLPTTLAPALTALRLALWQATRQPVQGFAAVVAAAEVAAKGLALGESWEAVAMQLAQHAEINLDDAAAIAGLSG